MVLFLGAGLSDAVDGYLAKDPDGQIVLHASGADLCLRGVEYDGMPGRDTELAKTTDAVVIRTPSSVEGCPALDSEQLTFLPIKSAYADRLVLANDAAVNLALRCYPDAPFFFDVRARGQFLVTASNRTLDHRVVADDDGACVIDTARDPLLHARIPFSDGPYEPFTNAFLSFQLSETASQNANQVVTISLSQTFNSVQNLVFDPAQGRRDALPVTVQYLPYTDNLFVVDSARQGLRIFTLSPFYPARVSFR